MSEGIDIDAINPTDQEFDSDGQPLLKAVQDAILPAVKRFGWKAVENALYHDPIWDYRNQGYPQ